MCNLFKALLQCSCTKGGWMAAIELLVVVLSGGQINLMYGSKKWL